MNGKSFIKHTLQILVSIGINYPVLRENFMVLQKPFLIITGDGNLEKAAGILSDSGTPRLDEYLSVKKLMAVLNDVNSDFVLCKFVQSKRGIGFLEMVAGIVTSGGIGGERFNALPVVIAEKMPYGCNKDRFFIICIDDFNDMAFDRFCVVPPEDEITVVSDKFNQEAADATDDESAFLAAACFLYPYFRDNGLGKEFADLLCCAKKLVELDENIHSLNGIGSFFVDELYRWQAETNFYRIYELPYLKTFVLQRLHEVILFDDRYIYMKDELFKKISSSLLSGYPVNILKKSLLDDGIICADNTNTYTVKMLYRDVAGNPGSERMLRFSRDKIDKAGEAGFVEICSSTKNNMKRSPRLAGKKSIK